MEMPASSDEIDRLLEEQVGYYEARAAEYEDCYLRRGRYDNGSAANADWFEQTALLEAAAHRFDASGDVLEIACGTGLWTRFLAPRATRLLAVDAAANVLELNRARYGGPTVDFRQVDIFDWAPPVGRRFDAIFFGFFISHIPPALFESFWSKLARWLAPGGRVFFCDDAAGSDRPFGGDRIERAPGYALRRSLTDGQEFTIVKVFYEEADLVRRLDRLGWRSDVRTTGSLFMHGTASPRR